jgi:uncharacterized membrane protein (DUF485 family)
VERVLRRDRRAAFAIGIASALLVGVAFGASLGFTSRVVGTSSFMAAVGIGILFGSMMFLTVIVYVASVKSPWARWEVIRIWLALRRKLPWQLMSFLAQSHEAGVLRQVGAMYQFRHPALQHRLASRGH